MAKKIEDIKQDSWFSPEEKSLERRGASAIAALITLPTLLGIVAGRNEWIYNGQWQSFQDHLRKRVQALFTAAQQNPMLSQMSGSKPLQVQLDHFRSQLIEKAEAQAGANTSRKVPPPPNWAKSSEDLAIARDAMFPERDMVNRKSSPADFPITVKDKLNVPIRSSESAYQNLTRTIIGGGSGKPEVTVHVNNRATKAELFTQIDDIFKDYTAGLTPGELSSIGANKAIINERMANLEQKHKALLNAIGHPELYNTTYNSGAYAKELANGLTAYKTQIADLKQQVNSLDQLAKTASDPKKRIIYKRQLFELAKHAGFESNPSQYVSMVNSMKVRLEVTSILRGDIPFPKATLVIDMGKYKNPVRQTFNIERFGMFLPHRAAQVHNSALLVQGHTSQNAVTATLAEMQDNFSNINKQINDLIDAGFEGYQLESMGASTRNVYRELVGPQTAHLQDIIRGFKVINDDFRNLSGERPDFFYKMHALAKQSFFTDSVVYQTDTPVIAFDLEFNSPSSGTKGSQLQTRDARTRMFWMNYIIKKGGSEEKIYNHFILPENWEDVRQSARLFTARHQDPSGFVLFEDLVQSFKEAQSKINKGERFVDLKKKGITRGMERIWSEWGSMVEVARNVYKSRDGVVAWLGHNIANADLPVLNKTVSRVLENDKERLTSNEIRLLERLRFDTSAASLTAKGLLMDTYAMSRAVFLDVERVTSASLENSFEVIINQAVLESNPERTYMKSETWTKGLSNAVQRSKGMINQEVKKYINDLPGDIRLGIKNWILQSPDDVVNTFGAQGHHSAPFDARKALILWDLNRWKMAKIKASNPDLYKTITQLGTTAEQIIQGKRFAWYRNIDLADNSSLFDIPEHGLGEGGPEAFAKRIYSHLFSFTPTAAARGIGGLIGPENYLPFGQYSNLQKQMYQTASSKTLLPGLSALEADVAKGQFPVVQRSIDATSGNSLWTTSLQANISRMFNEYQQRVGSLRAPIDNRFQVMAAYLPDHNSILAQDSALWANEQAQSLARHFPKGAEGTHPSIYSREAQQIVSALSARPGKEAKVANKLLKKIGIRPRSDVTVRQFLEKAGMPEGILKMVDNERGMGDALLKDIMKLQSDKNQIMQLKFQNSYKNRVDTLLGKNVTNVLGPGDALLNSWGDSIVKPDTGDIDWRRSKYDINNPLKYAAILDQITFDYEKGTFIYDITPFETPSFAKIVDSGKLLKGNVHGVANNLSMGTGIGLVLASKKPTMANLIDIHMRRSLLQIHKKDMPIKDQRKAIQKMITKAFNISAEEFQAVFKLTEGLPQAGQLYRNPIVMVELVDNYKLGLGGKEIMNNVYQLLKHSGVTHSNLRKQFIEMNRDLLKGYGIHSDIKEKLGKVYDHAVRKQRATILNMTIDIDAKNPNEAFIINEMKRIVKKTDVALFDPFIGAVGDEIDVKSILSGELYAADGTSKAGIKVEPFAWLFANEFMVAESTVEDVKAPQGRNVDSHGMPLNKTFSIWQQMIVYNNSRGNEPFQEAFMRHAMSTSGRYDKNIKKLLHVHMEAAAALVDGYSFDDIKFKSLSYEEMKKDIRHLSKLELGKLLKGGESQARIEQMLLARGSGPDEALRVAKQLSDDITLQMSKAGVEMGLLSPKALRQMNVFKGSKTFDYIKFELFSKENKSLLDNLLKTLSSSKKDLKLAIENVNLNNRAKLGAEIRRSFRNIAERDPGERKVLEKMFKQLPGSFLDPLDGILMPHIPTTNPIYLPEEGRYLLAGQSKVKTRMMEIITQFNDELGHVLKSKGGLTEKSLHSLKGMYDNLFADIAPQVVAGVYGGISAGVWKANQMYGHGQQYAKTLDSVLLAKNSLGGIIGKYKTGQKIPQIAAIERGISTWGQYLDTTITAADDPVVDALTKLKHKLGSNSLKNTINTNAKNLGMSVENYLNTKQGKYFLKLKKDIRGQQNILSELVAATKKITYGEVLAGLTTGTRTQIGNLAEGGYVRAAGLGLGESFIASSQLAASITSGDPFELIRELTSGGNEDAVSHWRKIMTGRTNLVNTIARNPMFENKLGYLFANTYVYHDKLFSDMGINAAELKKITAINGLELMLMGGDYDGDLAMTMLQTLKPNAAADGKFAEGVYKERMRLIEALRFRGMEMGADSLHFRGMNYNKTQIIKGWGGGIDRMLIAELGDDSAEAILAKQVGGIVQGIATNHAEDSLKARGLTYMVQQLLTGPIGEQQKQFDMLYGYGGGTNPGIKQDVVDVIKLKLQDPVKDRAGIATLLGDIGYAIDDKTDIERLAKRAIGEVDDAWRVLNLAADTKTFNPMTKEFTPTKYTKNVDLLFTWMRQFTHVVPIEKEKAAGQLPELISTVATKSHFHSGSIDPREQLKIANEVYSKLGIGDANFEKLYINPSSDLFDSPDSMSKALDMKQDLKMKFMDSVRAAMHLNAVGNAMVRGGHKLGNLNTALASKNPRGLIQGALISAFGEASDVWLGNELTSIMAPSEARTITNADDFAAMMTNNIVDQMELPTLQRRAGLETLKKFGRGLMEGIAHNRWTKRAAIGMLAFSIFDPNTNSILLPGQRGKGEENDIPSLAELTRGYRRREAKVRRTSPVLIDRLLRTTGMPSRFGTPGALNRYIPTPPPSTIRHSKRRRKDGYANLHELSRGVGGIIR